MELGVSTGTLPLLTYYWKSRDSFSGVDPSVSCIYRPWGLRLRVQCHDGRPHARVRASVRLLLGCPRFLSIVVEGLLLSLSWVFPLNNDRKYLPTCPLSSLSLLGGGRPEGARRD